MNEENKIFNLFFTALGALGMYLISEFRKGNIKLYLDGGDLRIVCKNKKHSFDHTFRLSEIKKAATALVDPKNWE